MKCKSCNTIVEANEKFCHNCGEKMDSQNIVADNEIENEAEIKSEPQSQTKKKPFILAIVGIVLVAIIVVVAVLARSTPEKTVKKYISYIEEEDLYKAVDCYSESFKSQLLEESYKGITGESETKYFNEEFKQQAAKATVIASEYIFTKEIENIIIKKIDKHKSYATVGATMKLDSENYDIDINLVKESGKWKMSSRFNED